MKKIIVLFSLSVVFLFASDKIEKRLLTLQEKSDQKTENVWIFFTDKNYSYQLNKSALEISELSVKRRQKLDKVNIFDIHDVPVNPAYINRIKPYTVKLRHESRWLNAVSAQVSLENLEKIASLDFVEQIKKVQTYIKKRPEKDSEVLSKSPSFNKTGSVNDIDYGNSFLQLDQVEVTRLHEKGLTGEGVVIAMLDDGFDLYKTHPVFERLKVLGTKDFVNGDDSVDDPGSGQGWHGTYTLSVIAGYDPGELVGSAYGAQYLLAKTEWDQGEIQQEEDNWVEGLEWVEKQGADIANSSLGYYDWYTWEDFDGQTAVTTKATVIAEDKGLIVVNSAGNNGRWSNIPEEGNTLNAPADGEFVITVGAIDLNSSYWSASSYGPTADGRVKPDVMALGAGVYHASGSKNLYSTGNGTSFSSPITAGAIALLLEADPTLTPARVREAIRKTATLGLDNPDRYLGYGILQIEKAYDYVIDGKFETPSFPENVTLHQNFPNPFNGTSTIEFELPQTSRVQIRIYDAIGRLVHTFAPQIVKGFSQETVSGNLFDASGIYFYVLDVKEIVSGRAYQKTRKLVYVK